jgi:hypothetical protein
LRAIVRRGSIISLAREKKMRICVLSLAALVTLAAPAPAETADDKRKAIAAVFETALREHAVFLNCSATDPELHGPARTSGEETIAASIALMTSHKADSALIAQFKDRGAYTKVMRLDAPLREIMAMCPAGWQKPYFEYRFVVLHSRVSNILNR